MGMNKTTHPYFVPNGDSRHETAILLVGTADEFGIDQREVRMIRGGFRISQTVADALGLDTGDAVSDEPEAAEPEPEPEAAEPEPEPEAAEPEPEPEPDAAESYFDWDYAAVKAEVSYRGLDTENKKFDTLVAALEADDLTSKTNASGNRAGENEE